MARSPYEPPKSSLGELDTQRGVPERPYRVVRAVVLLWLSLLVGALIFVLEFEFIKRTAASASMVWVVSLGALGISALLTASIYARQNWARIVFLVLFLLGGLPYLAVLSDMFGRSKVAALLSLTQLLLQAAAIYLLFTKPGSLWFRHGR